MIVKTYYRDGRTDAFDTANLTDASMYRGNVVTNWSLDLSGAMREDGVLLLSMRWYPAPGQDAPVGPEGLPIVRRRDGLCVVVADREDVPQLSMVTVTASSRFCAWETASWTAIASLGPRASPTACPLRRSRHIARSVHS